MTKELSLEQQIKDDADRLFSLFENNITYVDEESVRVTDGGLKNMSVFFGSVPIENRGYVFLNFLNSLYKNGYSYDLLQFMDMDEVINE